MRKPLLSVAILMCWMLATVPCVAEEMVRLTGRTMGTTYHITYQAIPGSDAQVTQTAVDERLKKINKAMSTYIPSSEISRFNKLRKTGEPFPISKEFTTVMMEATKIHTLTKGSWDGTVATLVNLWGFGSKKSISKIPEPSQIKEALKHTGFKLIQVDPNGSLTKKDPHVTLDLGSIAKGFGVDAVTRTLQDLGIKNALVEIGGEVFALGRKSPKKNWRVGINKPDKSAALSDVYKAIPLNNKAMATSGDYRNFFREKGRQYSHVIDPVTGRSVETHVVSASVIANNCTFADGLATALMVMGSEKGINLVNQLQGIECMIVVRNTDNTFTDFYSNGFP